MTPELLLEEQTLAPALKVMLLLGAASLLPAILLSMTSFVRIVVVLSLLRQGLGSMQSPPTQVIVGLSLFLTAFTMAPVMSEIQEKAWEPMQRNELTEFQAIEAATLPTERFMLRQTREKDLALFYEFTGKPLPERVEDVPLTMAMPAFVLSEMTTAFQMGVIVLLPFLVVDLAVASLLMSMGMMMVPPTMMSLPIKLLLFVLVDGWNLVAGSLLRSFA
ncbi:MAG: flagellar type III secretion system pore protein FliP [Polyangiaceae bacterium]|nr:flagellar type III secretion system pore protein FliP [Polyangiaceae bacterium]